MPRIESKDAAKYLGVPHSAMQRWRSTGVGCVCRTFLPAPTSATQAPIGARFPCNVFRCVVILVALFGTCCVRMQAQRYAALLEVDSLGSPYLVAGSDDQWTIPLTVYRDANVQIFIPDITGDGWLFMNAGHYPENGMFEVDLFTRFISDDYRRSHICTREEWSKLANLNAICALIRYERSTILVDTKRRTVTTIIRAPADRTGEGILEVTYRGKVVSGFDSLASGEMEAIKRVTAMVERSVQNAVSYENDIRAGIKQDQERAALTTRAPQDQSVHRIGGGVSPPVLVFSVEPEFSEKARKAKVGGNVLVNLYVDTNGNPIHVRVIRSVGMGLDEQAVEAVRQYKFRPAMENGKPVLVELNVEVNFQIDSSPRSRAHVPRRLAGWALP